MRTSKWVLGPLLGGLLALAITGGFYLSGPTAHPSPAFAAAVAAPQPPRYTVLAWNDLGMHCYNRDFSNLGVLPPYNTLWAQVVQLGDPPQIITQTVSVEFSFPDNTYSVGKPGWPDKSNFWQYAQKLFHRPQPLPDNVGLAGNKLAGVMAVSGDHFEAEGIPLTEYSDSEVAKNPTNPMAWQRQPLQLAQIVVKDKASGAVLAQASVVAPVSTEMHCDTCHSNGQREGIATGKVETNILALHDLGEHTNLLGSQPVLCADCHSSNALRTPGVPDVASLSHAMHTRHMEANIPSTTDGCYSCHPGPQTRCLRDVMSTKLGFQCQDCHGTLARVSQNPNPWLNEPRCDNGGCHSAVTYGLDQPLYRMSKGVGSGMNSTGHGGIRCEACHDSTHAIAPSRDYNDGIKFRALQGDAGPLRSCSACHVAQLGGRIHPLQSVPLAPRVYLPVGLR